MYHLFDKLYVEVDGRAVVEQPQINISENTGFEFVEHPLALPRGEQLGYGLSLDAFSKEEFAALLSRAVDYKSKVMLYVDNATYTRLYALILKSLFPDIDYATFKMFFICIKATYDTSTVNFHDTVVDHSNSVTINRKVVEDLYNYDDPLLTTLQDLFLSDTNGISLEWRIIKLRAKGIVGALPKTIKNIMRRTALSNSHDAMDDWGRVIVDPTRWDISGCTEDSLLDSVSTFAACKNFGSLTEEFLRTPQAMGTRSSNRWIIDLLETIVVVLTSCGDLPSAARSQNLLDCFNSPDDLEEPELCLARLNFLFDGGPARFRLAHLDSAKYDENLIRFVLRLSDENVNKLFGTSQW